MNLPSRRLYIGTKLCRKQLAPLHGGNGLFDAQDVEAQAMLDDMHTANLAWINDKNSEAKKSVHRRIHALESGGDHMNLGASFPSPPPALYAALPAELDEAPLKGGSGGITPWKIFEISKDRR